MHVVFRTRGLLQRRRPEEEQGLPVGAPSGAPSPRAHVALPPLVRVSEVLPPATGLAPADAPLLHGIETAEPGSAVYTEAGSVDKKRHTMRVPRTEPEAVPESRYGGVPRRNAVGRREGVGRKSVWGRRP